MKEEGLFRPLFFLFELTYQHLILYQDSLPRITELHRLPPLCGPPYPPPSIFEGKIEIEQIGFRHNRSCQSLIDSNSRGAAISRSRPPNYVRRCAIPSDEMLPSIVFQVLGAVVPINVLASDRLVPEAQDQQGEFGRGCTCLHDFLCYSGSKPAAYAFALLGPVTGADFDFERCEEWKALYQVLSSEMN